jgi:hypothetical protein
MVLKCREYDIASAFDENIAKIKMQGTGEASILFITLIDMDAS